MNDVSYTTSADTLDLVPAPLRAFVGKLAFPSFKTVPLTAETTSFVYAYGEADRTYTTGQYPAGGTWTGVTTPWLNDLSTVPAVWQWTAADTSAQQQRADQVARQMAAMKPAGGYEGSTAEQIFQRYANEMWSTEVFTQQQLDSLFVWIDDDAEFARQRLGGANTNVIASAGEFDVDAWVQAASNGAQLGSLAASLKAAQAEGRLYVCDYRPVLGSVVTKQLVQNGTHLAAPVCLFVVEGSSLTPAAIQVEATDKNAYIFTPKDPDDPEGDAWLLAKLWAANADQTWWFSGSHLFNTHSIDMVFGIAALEQLQAGVLPANHPMLTLAKPHLVKVFNINNAVYDFVGKQGIYQQSQFCDKVLPTGRIGIYEIIDNLYQDYDFACAAFDRNLSRRGLDAGAIAAVPFPYRDDGLVWWTELQKFVAAIVDSSYVDDAAVAADQGLNAWMKSVQTAFNTNQAAAPRFTWTPTKAALGETFTNLIFVCSVQHCAVNDSMFNAWAFLPNGPFSMQAPPPKDAKSVTQQVVLGSLPDPTQPGSDGGSTPTTDMNAIRNQVTFVMSGTAKVPETLAGGATGDLHDSYPYPQGSAQYTAVGNFAGAIENTVKPKIGDNQTHRSEPFAGKPVPNSASYYYLSVSAVASMFLNAPATQAIQI